MPSLGMISAGPASRWGTVKTPSNNLTLNDHVTLTHDLDLCDLDLDPHDLVSLKPENKIYKVSYSYPYLPFLILAKQGDLEVNGHRC